jgi:formate dehydrogenase assembly factor FdhD
MTYRPEITRASRPLTFEVEAINERGEMVPTAIAGENPLTLYVDKREIVTLMTLGQAPEALPSATCATSGCCDRSRKSPRCKWTGKPTRWW